MRPHVMEHVELFVLLQHGAEGIPPSPSPHLAQDPARSDLLTTSFVDTPCCCQILIRLTGLITAGEGCQVLRPPDSICDETCLEALGKLSKSRLFLPSGRHVALLGGFLPLLLFYSRALSRPSAVRVVRYCFSPPHRAPLLPPRRCICARAVDDCMPPQVAPRRIDIEAVRRKKDGRLSWVPVHPHPSIPAYRVRVEAASLLELESLRPGRRRPPGKDGHSASPSLPTDLPHQENTCVADNSTRR